MSKTNDKFVADLMNFSRQGALMHVFVIQALENYADQVLSLPASEYNNSLVNGAAWHRCAAEVKAQIEENYGS